MEGLQSVRQRRLFIEKHRFRFLQREHGKDISCRALVANFALLCEAGVVCRNRPRIKKLVRASQVLVAECPDEATDDGENAQPFAPAAEVVTLFVVGQVVLILLRDLLLRVFGHGQIKGSR